MGVVLGAVVSCIPLILVLSRLFGSVGIRAGNVEHPVSEHLGKEVEGVPCGVRVVDGFNPARDCFLGKIEMIRVIVAPVICYGLGKRNEKFRGDIVESFWRGVGLVRAHRVRESAVIDVVSCPLLLSHCGRD